VIISVRLSVVASGFSGFAILIRHSRRDRGVRSSCRLAKLGDRMRDYGATAEIPLSCGLLRPGQPLRCAVGLVAGAEDELGKSSRAVV
jgi:hypothetical protein